MTAATTVALGVLCHDRPRELSMALGSAAGFNEVIVLDMASDPPLDQPEGANQIREEVNIGVAAGRNRLADVASSDVLVFLDDDAVFLTDAVAELVRDRFMLDPRLGVLAFRIVRADGTTVSAEHPFRGRPRDVERGRPCAYFLGGACAVRRDAFLAAGGFDDRFRYSTEEIDLAFALARQGRDLVYDPQIIVEHRPSSRGRAPNANIPALRLRNRLLLVRRHLPVPLALLHTVAWGTRTGFEAARVRGLREWRTAWNDGLRQPMRREPLSYRALTELHRRGGRVLW